jgi:hypothetical protein
MSEPKRIYAAGRPRDRSFEAYVDWVRDFVARLIPGAAAQDLTDPAEHARAEASWRSYWAAIDRQEQSSDEPH